MLKQKAESKLPGDESCQKIANQTFREEYICVSLLHHTPVPVTKTDKYLHFLYIIIYLSSVLLGKKGLPQHFLLSF